MRIWITGVGITSALGASARETFDALIAGKRGLSEIDLFDTADQRARIAGQVRGLHVPPGPVWSRSSALALAAAGEAMRHAQLSATAARVGLVVGGTTAGMFEDELRVSRMLALREPRRPLPEMRSHPLSSTLDALDGVLGPFCRHAAAASACSSGSTALWTAMSWLALDESLDAVVAGGSDGLCRLTVTGFNALAAMDPVPCRPFDRERRGMNLGEGAGFVVLERASRASARRAVPIAELASVALCAEAHHITNPEPSGVRAGTMISRAIELAGIDPSMVDYVNAHGTATPLNDVMEARALAFALGPHVARVPVSSCKGQLGHTLGAAGAIEAVIGALAIATGQLPATAGLGEIDPECSALQLLRASQRGQRVRAVVSNSFGFGGMDAAVVLTQPELSSARSPQRRRVVVTGGASLGPRGLVSSSEAASLGEGEVAGGNVSDVASRLDPARARRFDRSAKLTTTAAQAALADARVVDGSRFGAVIGSAYGAVDECAAFMLRIVDKGPRLASPAEFPNLVPSSPVGHASIYLGLRGPALAVADLQTSGESALCVGVEAIASGAADAMLAGACDVGGALVDEVFGPLFSVSAPSASLASEGAALLALEAESFAEARGARILAVIEAFRTARGERWTLPDPRTPARAKVVASAPDLLVDSPAWDVIARVDPTIGAGRHAGGGASAAVVALGLLASQAADEVLLVGGRCVGDASMARYAFVLRRA